MCIAGHTPNGKADVAGAAEIDPSLGVSYGRELAEKGVLTVCPDNAGMGERADPEQGGCDMTWRKLNMLGYDMTGFRAYDLIRAVDLLEELQAEGGGPLVDKDRIGIAGLSGGCWLGIVMAALEPRVCAAALSGFFSTFKQTNWVGHCVCHHPFGEQRHPCRRRGRVPINITTTKKSERNGCMLMQSVMQALARCARCQT